MVEMTAATWLGCTATMLASEWYHRRQLQCIRHRVLVSGMRGKSTAVSLLHQGFRSLHLKTLSRITGDEVIQLLPDGSEKRSKRFGSPNIREMRSVVRKASRDGCDVLCLENMAIQPDFVKLASTHIVNPTLIFHCVDGIDHTEYYPEDSSIRAKMIVDTWPEKTPVLIINTQRNEMIIRIAKESGRHVIVPETKNDHQLRLFMSDLVAAVECAIFQCTGQKVEHDFFRTAAVEKQSVSVYMIDERPVIDLRSANDPDSTVSMIESLKAEKQLNDFQLVYLHRADRPGRLLSFDSTLKRYPSIVSGDIVPWTWKRKSGIPVIRNISEVFRKFQVPVILTGNRHGDSEKMLDKFLAKAPLEKW